MTPHEVDRQGLAKSPPEERYAVARYGAVCIVPMSRRLGVDDRIQYDPGTRGKGKEKHKWAVDAVCFDKEHRAFTAEYRARQRVFLHPKMAVQIVRSVCHKESPDRAYAEWLAEHKCQDWEALVEEMRKEAEAARKEVEQNG